MTEQNLGHIYERRSSDFGPQTYSDTEFAEKIAFALKLGSYNEGARILDAMSGPGKLADMPRQLLSGTSPQFHFIDLSAAQLHKITQGNPVVGDVRNLPYQAETFDAVYARYALKDLTADDQVRALAELVRSIKPGGAFILADMYAPSNQVLPWLNKQHSMKQEFSGRNTARVGHCNIRTIPGWIDSLDASGLKASVVLMHLSQVTTTDWQKSNQVNEEQLHQLDKFILSAPTEAVSAFNIRSEGNKVMIDYPICIIRGEKFK